MPPTPTAPIEILETVDSTNLEAKRRIETGAVQRGWLLAREQTAGYGRRGRAWFQDPGDLAATLMFQPDGPVDRYGQLSFIIALAVASVLDDLGLSDRTTLKWPNDVLLDDGKLAGILLEHLMGPDGPWLLIGVGFNILGEPEGTAMRPARLADYCKPPPSSEELLASLDGAFWTLHAQWRRSGFAPIRREWLARATRLGETITARLPNEEITGIFEDVDENGALILRIGAQKRIISAGDVFFH